jgi:acyl-CoA synthetase (AMP-forming)/AMP-acid ligase II
VTDRVKELIKYKTYQVAPAELEALLFTHPAVADAAFVRKRDALAGEIPKAFVVLRAPASADELMAWVGERVAGYKRVRQIEFTDHIPRSRPARSFAGCWRRRQHHAGAWSGQVEPVVVHDRDRRRSSCLAVTGCLPGGWSARPG